MQEELILLVKLFLAHLIGDFLLQPDSWVIEKETKKIKSAKLYFHALIHGGLVILIVGKMDFWPQVAVIVASHWFIDLLKLYLQKEKTKRILFFLDQLLHIMVLVTIVYWWYGISEIPLVLSDSLWVHITAMLFLTVPASVVVKSLISKWAPYTEEQEGESLQNAGKFIGILERQFVLLFVITGHWEAVGFLIAAKSVFRFGDLKESRDRKLTEYILIGTLLSFGIALVCGILAEYLVSFANQNS